MLVPTQEDDGQEPEPEAEEDEEDEVIEYVTEESILLP